MLGRASRHCGHYGIGVAFVPGKNYSKACSGCELYDAPSNSWSTVASLAQPLMQQAAVLLTNGDVLVVTGYSVGIGGGSYSGVAELYDPNLDTWSPAGTPITPTFQGTATLLGNGDVLLIGNSYNASVTVPTWSPQLYDPVAMSWSSAAGSYSPPNMPGTRSPVFQFANGIVLYLTGSPNLLYWQ